MSFDASNPLCSRRIFLAGAFSFSAGLALRRVIAAPMTLGFDELYGKRTVLGLEFSGKLKDGAGRTVRMRGYMAPPLKAESNFFVLTSIPMALCPFCSSDADWPDDIVVVYLDRAQTFVQTNGPLNVEGRLEYGSWTDPVTGFVSLVRLTKARFVGA
jgi:hypothetical protein